MGDLTDSRALSFSMLAGCRAHDLLVPQSRGVASAGKLRKYLR